MYDTCASVSWVHCEGSGNREDGFMRDGGVKMNETEQGKDTRQASKHGQVYRTVLGWGSGWPPACNQSSPEIAGLRVHA